MPIYTFRKKNSKKEYNLEMSIAERETYLKENSDVEQVLNAMNISHVSNVNRKTDNAFRDRLKTIHKNSPRSFIETGNLGEL